MKNKKFRYSTFILLILILIRVINTPNSLIKSTNLFENNREIDTDIIKQAAYWELNYININNNWSETASTYDWCSGSGTLENPYIIENIKINLGSSESGIKVQNSAHYFIIQNCTVNHQANGIYLRNVRNGFLQKNNCSVNIYDGILLNNCMNITISNNFASSNMDSGISLYNSTLNYVTENIIYENIGGARWVGIFLEESHNNTVFNNDVYLNGDIGIELLNSDNNSIVKNNIDSNWNGIRVGEYCYSNIFTENTIQNCNAKGLYFDFNNDDNRVFKNYFINNTLVHAEDNGAQNHWNNTNIGNYWDDYAGVDADVNGIGDSSYSISGMTGIDYLPIYGNPFHNGSSIFINGTKISGFESWQWLSTRAYCSGSGIEEDPYILEHLDINGQDLEDCIEIINSNKFFEIKYCNLYNSSTGFYEESGLHLVNCSNGVISYNNLSLLWNGIFLYECFNIKLNANIITETQVGILAQSGSYNIISFNIISECSSHGVSFLGDNPYKYILNNNQFINNFPGVYLFGKAHELFNNTFKGSGICIGYDREEVISYKIDTSNTLNNKPIYYYANKTNLSLLNFINAGQILLANCNNSKVADLNFTDTGLPILMVYCSNNEISNISIMNEIYGMGLFKCYNNTFSKLSILNNGIGIWLLGYCDNNNFINNEFINNSHAGIKSHFCDYNLFSNNLFKDNHLYGFYFDSFSERNLVYRNVFINNAIHAYDESTQNYWDNGILGNYWDDYNGSDLDFDGIGDTPYNISGTTGNQDNFPLIYPPYPEILIMKPSENTIFGATPPEFEISLQGFNIVKTWYTIDNGAHNYTIIELSGTINQTAWNSAANGPVTIRFYAKDEAGNVGQSSITITKRSTQEQIPPGIPGFNLIALVSVTSIITIILIKRKSKK